MSHKQEQQDESRETKLHTSSHPHLLSKVEIPWQHAMCLHHALLMKIHTTHIKINKLKKRKITNMITGGWGGLISK